MDGIVPECEGQNRPGMSFFSQAIMLYSQLFSNKDRIHIWRPTLGARCESMLHQDLTDNSSESQPAGPGVISGTYLVYLVYYNFDQHTVESERPGVGRQFKPGRLIIIYDICSNLLHNQYAITSN
jgi:hypothetical protein